MNFKILLIALSFFSFKKCNSGNVKILEETNGFIAVEAEDFHSQELDNIRKWYQVDENNTPDIQPDIDGNHAASASGKAYLEILPDTRTNHDEKEWPESGRRLQWCKSQNRWAWDSKQRTKEEHCGIPKQIYFYNQVLRQV